MGYQITIKANAGSVTVTTEGDLPDGEHVITGHDDGHLVSLHAERRSELGRYVIHTQHAIDRQQHAQASGAPQAQAVLQPEPEPRPDESPPFSLGYPAVPAGDDRFA